MTSLIHLEKKGVEALNNHNYQLAIDSFKKIISIRPDYEHGACFYHLACSYEDIGNLDLARKNYEMALSYMPDNEIYLGGYASFLYLHGNPVEAFSAYLKLLKIKKINNQDTASVLSGLNSLGKKLGWDDKKIQNEIKESLY